VARGRRRTDGYRRAYGLNDPGPAKHRLARVDRDGRSAAAATRLAAEAADGPRRPDSQAAASAPIAEATAGSRRLDRTVGRLERDGR
jgi:hypothetical protein